MEINMKNKKNLTLYGLVILSGILTIPIAFIIIKNFSNSSDVIKALFITAVFVVLAAAIILIYRQVFDVPIDVITQDKEVTKLGRKKYWFTAYIRKQRFSSSYMKRLYRSINRNIEQIESFYRRKDVFSSLLEELQGEQSGAIADMAALVENSLDFNSDKIIDRIKIFDDKLQVFLVEQNLEYIEEYINKNDQVLMEFEKLITEVSGMSGSESEVDISKLTDIITAMQNLRRNEDSQLEDLKKKYQ